MIDSFTLLSRKIIENNFQDFYYLSIDPGLANIGWCVVSFNNFTIIDYGKLSLDISFNKYKNDIRFGKIYLYVQNIILKYGINVICIEKINFSNGKYSFAEQGLLKSIGVIYAAIFSEEKSVFEINNRQAQKILLGKAKNMSKKDIFDYVYSLVSDQLDENSIKKIFVKSKNDICDSIFLSYAFRYIILQKLLD